MSIRLGFRYWLEVIFQIIVNAGNGVDLRSNLIRFGQLGAFLIDPLILHKIQFWQGISSIIMCQLSVQSPGQN
jgi:hypothetical protein